MVDAYQIPEDVLHEMSTKSLVLTVLNNPFLAQFDVYNRVQDAIEMNRQIFNVYGEMMARPDYQDALLEIYEETSQDPDRIHVDESSSYADFDGFYYFAQGLTEEEAETALQIFKEVI